MCLTYKKVGLCHLFMKFDILARNGLDVRIVMTFKEISESFKPDTKN